MPEQEELLVRMVEAARRLPSDQRRKFLLSQTMGGDDLIHPGLADDQTRVAEDVETLAATGLLAVTYGSRGTPNYNLTPLGYQHYEHLKVRGSSRARSDSCASRQAGVATGGLPASPAGVAEVASVAGCDSVNSITYTGETLFGDIRLVAHGRLSVVRAVRRHVRLGDRRPTPE